MADNCATCTLNTAGQHEPSCPLWQGYISVLTYYPSPDEPTDADLTEIARLRAENEALRTTLAQVRAGEEGNVNMIEALRNRLEAAEEMAKAADALDVIEPSGGGRRILPDGYVCINREGLETFGAALSAWRQRG